MRMCQFVCAAIVACALVFLCGCETESLPTPKPGAVTLPEQIRDAEQAVKHQHATLVDMGKVINSIKTLDEPTRLRLAGMCGDALKDNELIGTILVKAESSAKTEAKQIEEARKEIAALKAEDPVRSWLQYIGIAALLGGVGAVIVGIWFGVSLAKTAGAASATFGLCVLTLAYFLTEIRWLIGLSIVAAIVAGIVYVILHRKVIADKLSAAVADSPTASGAVSGIAIGGLSSPSFSSPGDAGGAVTPAATASGGAVS